MKKLLIIMGLMSLFTVTTAETCSLDSNQPDPAATPKQHLCVYIDTNPDGTTTRKMVWQDASKDCA